MQPQMNMNQGMPQMSQMSQMGQQPMNQGMNQPMNQGMSAGMPQMPDLSANNFINLASGMPDELPFN